jgi:acyl carrier protein
MNERVWDRLTSELAVTLDLAADSPLLKADSRLRDDLGMSSLRTVDLIIRLEDALEIAVSDDDLAGLVTLGDVAGMIERLLGDRA